MSQSTSGSNTQPVEVDMQKYPTAQKLLSRCQDFFKEIENMYNISELQASIF
jgi:hypothetical protein